jgi:hypothetical protein
MPEIVFELHVNLIHLYMATFGRGQCVYLFAAGKRTPPLAEKSAILDMNGH